MNKREKKVKAKIEDENYRLLVDKSEDAYQRGDYLEAFLIQSCVIEGVIKHYAQSRMEDMLTFNKTLKNKFSNFEFARLIDELLIAGKIDNDLYSRLDQYRKKRNDIIHNLLTYNKKRFRSELRSAYKSGRDMKMLIIEDLRRDLTPDIVLSEMRRKVDQLKIELEGYNPGSRSHTATQAEIYRLLEQMMTVVDKPRTIY